MNPENTRTYRRIIDNDWQTDVTPADRQPVRMPYQTDSSLFTGWGIKL